MHNWKKCTSATVLFIPLDLLINYYRVLISPLETVIIADTEFCEISHKSAQPVLHNSRFHFPPQPCPDSHYPYKPQNKCSFELFPPWEWTECNAPMSPWFSAPSLSFSLRHCVVLLLTEEDLRAGWSVRNWERDVSWAAIQPDLLRSPSLDAYTLVFPCPSLETQFSWYASYFCSQFTISYYYQLRVSV